MLGSRIQALLEATPLAEGGPLSSLEEAEAAAAASGGAAAREVLGAVPGLGEEELQALTEVVMGRMEDWDLLPGSLARSKAAEVREALLDPDTRRRLAEVRAFTAGGDGRGGHGPAFPGPPPKLPEDRGVGLDGWAPPAPAVITL